jgi:probable rRNA maturation factor
VIEIDLSIDAAGWSELGDPAALARRAVDATLAVAPETPGGDFEIALLLTADAAVHDLNRIWRSRDEPTNVLSFPAPSQPWTPGPRALGDLVLGFETVAAEAAAEGKTLAEHAAHLIVHGVLHLLGYDHGTEAEAGEMEALEVKTLARLGIANPYREVAA